MKTLIMMFRYAGIALVVFSISSSSCSRDLPEKEVIPEGFEPYSDDTDGYTLIKPAAWTVETRTEEDGREYRVFSGPKDEDASASNMSVIVSDALDKTISGYTQDLFSSYIRRFKQFDLEYRDTLKIHDITFGDFIIKFTLNDVAYRMRTVYTIHDSTLYQLNAIAPVELYEKEKETFDRIITSFEVVP